MRFLFLLSIIFLCGCHTDGNVTSSSIVGGKPVDLTQTDTSYIVSIGDHCAGSIIGSKWILTAAHCESLFKDRMYVRNKSGKKIRLKVLKSHLHPKYKKGEFNDVALLELKQEIDFVVTQLSSIEIADPDFESRGGLPEGLMTTVYGWGHTREDGGSSSVLREVDVPLVSRETANAKNSYKGKIDNSMLVAGYKEGKKDSCQGDSGGPMVIKDETMGTLTLIGIVSFGDGCGRPNKYGIYTNVSYVAEWIQSVMNEQGSTSNETSSVF